MTSNYDQSFHIPIKSVIHFKEYELDRHENKKIRNQMDGELFAIITPDERLNSDMISTYYAGVSEEFYPMLSHHPFVRLVLVVGSNKFGVPIYRVVALNKYYMMVGLQSVEYEEKKEFQPKVPNQILGFNSYSFGEKFKE